MPATWSRRSIRRMAAFVMLTWMVSAPSYAFGPPVAAVGAVDRLATTNTPPVIRGDPGEERAVYGDKFDHKESKRVAGAVKEVVRRAEELWPELVAHLGDDRHCLTVGSDAGYPRNWSVGDVCQDILGTTLSAPYYRHMMPATKETFHRFHIPAIAKDKAELRKWCLARKDRKLFELQIEQCEWAITEIDASDGNRNGKLQLTAAIEKEVESLKKSRTAIPCVTSF